MVIIYHLNVLHLKQPSHPTLVDIPFFDHHQHTFFKFDVTVAYYVYIC